MPYCKKRVYRLWILMSLFLFFLTSCAGFEKKMAVYPKKKFSNKPISKLKPLPNDNDLRYFYPPDTDSDDEGDVETNSIQPAVCQKSQDIPDNWDSFFDFYEQHGLCLDGSENEMLLTTLFKWLGTPYKIGGCSINGIDCSCFVRTIYRDVYGFELSRTSASIFYENAVPLSKDELREGDIICFITRKKRISHIGIYLKDDLFIHATRKKGVVIDSLNDPYYEKTYYSAGRIKDSLRYSLKTEK